MARLNAAWFNFSTRGQTWTHFWQDAATATGPTTACTISQDQTPQEEQATAAMQQAAIVSEAQQALAVLRDSPASQGLWDLASFVVARNR